MDERGLLVFVRGSASFDIVLLGVSELPDQKGLKVNVSVNYPNSKEEALWLLSDATVCL